ncbi:hypothetical protein SEUCBS139899_000783 [Sporothrix eucalyptigena]|uniref:UBL3-like ubiquitin domain-containing protein n=1 Tax=Sporothrix eucalyptigena TaxID=1812306 RepID=A0ABP0AVG8_9PEZI
MSGANEAAATAEQERVHEVVEAAVVDSQSNAKASSSLPSTTEASKEAAAVPAATEPAAVTATETTAEESAAPAEATGTATDAPAPSSTGGVLEAPRPPPAAVVRSASNQDDEIAPVTSSSGALVCNITLLLPTGNRHPFKIDDKYLNKRGVAVPDVTEAGLKDPFSISIYKLKELILREWREDWESKPASPSSIRLIHFGKLLDDKEQLRKYHFSPDSPNVVHMSVKPPEMMEDEEAAKGKSSGREARARESGGGCCVIL